jgi:carbonic anhydrase
VGPDQEGVNLRVVAARTEAEWAAAERLVRAYLAELPFPVDFQDVDAELADLPGAYGAPDGAMLLVVGGEHGDGNERAPVGVAGIRRFDAEDGELKRMYLVPAARGRGTGRALAVAAIGAARARGYRRLLLDTVGRLEAAIALYRSLGFVEVDAYRHNPIDDARYFALDLGAG